MQVSAIHLDKIVPPKDDLVKKISASKLKLKDGDVLAISSKVVSIGEGRTISAEKITKETLIKKEADLYYAPKFTKKWGYMFTITKGVLIGSAGVDQSNGNGYFVLWPKNPMRSAARLRIDLMREYKLKKLGVVITDSTSRPLRRGASGFALAWAGFEPLYDYRGTPDIFGRPIHVEQANIVDGLAAAAVLVMGEGSEQTPIALLRDVPKTIWDAKQAKKNDGFIVPMERDLFAPFFKNAPWKKGKR